MRRRGFRIWAKWACTAIGLLIVTVWGASGWFRVYRERGLPGWTSAVHSSGAAGLDLSDATPPFGGRNRMFVDGPDVEETVTVWEAGGGSIGFTVYDSTLFAPPLRAPACEVGPTPTRWRFEWQRVAGPGTFYRLPMWPLAAVAFLGTAIAWAPTVCSAVRVRRGRCAKCGYDRLGLAPGANCPECGGRAP